MEKTRLNPDADAWLEITRKTLDETSAYKGLWNLASNYVF
jgi:hypothetical protein